MIAENTYIKRETSAVRFMESLKSKMELLMKTGDIVTAIPKKDGGKKIVTDPKEEKRLLDIAVKRRQQGDSFDRIAEDTPWTSATLFDLMKRRGLHDVEASKAKSKAKRERIYELAREVHKLRVGMSIPQAIARFNGEITADQYQRARADLDLTPINPRHRP